MATDTGPFSPYLANSDMDFYGFPLVAAMREAFTFGGDLRALENPKAAGRALEGTRAVTFVRNHDVDRGQHDDRGITGDGRRTFGVGWDDGCRCLNRTDAELAYAYVLGREEGLPYVFADMPTEPEQDDRFDDPLVVAGIRFHNLSLAGAGGVAERPDVWRIRERDTVGWQRGDDRFIVVNKSADRYRIDNLPTTLRPGAYEEIRTGWMLRVEAGGIIRDWDVPRRNAMMFVRVGG